MIDLQWFFGQKKAAVTNICERQSPKVKNYLTKELFNIKNAYFGLAY